MLDRVKLAQELERLSDELFVDFSADYAMAKDIWSKICADTSFAHKVENLTDAPWPVPWWHNQQLDRVLPIIQPFGDYRVVSIDGSQIYPDRHQGLSCFLVNIGTVVLSYGTSAQPVQMHSQPYVFSGNTIKEEYELSPEFVNCRRHELELRAGLTLSKEIMAIKATQGLSLLAVDGSLIFWHLEGKSLKDRFLDVYLLLLLQFCQEKIPIIGYISSPKSKELVNLLRLWLCNFNYENRDSYQMVNHMVDASIVQFFLPPFCRTIVFQNRSTISQVYPASIHPYFFYLHVGTEIGRVELPAWMAQDEQLVDQIAALMIDQCIKGRGYPVVIAEAHEQAVVKGPDREIFYHLLKKMSIEHNQRIFTSVKSQRKMHMGV